MPAPAIAWFRADLRLADNPALLAAVASGGPVLPVFILDPDAGPHLTGAASRWWLHGSLAELGPRLAALGAPLVLRRGPAAEVLGQLAAETGADTVYWNAMPGEGAALAGLRSASGATLDLRPSPPNLLFDPKGLRTGGGVPYQVFTPFWSACLRGPPPALPRPAPVRIPGLAAQPPSLTLDELELRPRAPDWSGGLAAAWVPGEAAALSRLAAFIDGDLATYRAGRDAPGRAGTSRLSPYLSHGELSARQAYAAVSAAMAAGAVPSAEGAAFLRQLGWRDFSAYQLHHRPDLAREPLRREYAAFPWQADPALLKAWQRGRTGYPIVDAGMRELWTTGWMHNRVRMIVASFLVKDLLQPWQSGLDWFRDTLVDADLANNAAGWQWVAGCGADAAPFFRIFNPVLQGRKFDPDGAYVRRFVPELSHLPAALIHAPWEGGLAPPGYPPPCIDHGAARRRALDALATLRDRRAGSTAPLL